MLKEFLFACRVLSVPVLLTSSLSSLLEASVHPLPPDWLYKGGDSAPLQAEVSDLIYDGGRAQVLRLISRPPNAEKAEKGLVTQEVKIDIKHFRSLAFKARFKGKPLAFKISISGPGSLAMSQEFVPQGQADRDGFHHFDWELPAIRKDVGTVTGLIRLTTDPESLKEGEVTEIEIIDFAFKSEGKEASPHSVAPRQWVKTGPLEILSVPLNGWKPEDQEAGKAVKIEQVSTPIGEALQLSYHHADKFTPISLPFKVNANEFNTLTFKAKVETPAGVKTLGKVEAPLTGWYSYQFNQFFDNFGISLHSKGGIEWTKQGIPRTHFLQHLDRSEEVTDGFSTFRWDIRNDNPTGNKGFDLEEAVSLQFFYDNKKLKEGDKVVITIADPKFIKGFEHTGGDMERNAKFRKYIETYQPDYSDSTKYLSSPENGRLATAIHLVKDRVAVGEIIGQSSVWTPDGNAVNELYSWIYKLTSGVQVPVAKNPSSGDRARIFVGNQYAKELFATDLEALKGSDGCAIRQRGNEIYIFGATPKGTLNGVYTFIENNSDLIWAHPSRYLEAIYTESPNFTITWGDYLHRPQARHWGWMGDAAGPTLDYQIRNRCNYVGIRSNTSFRYWGLYMEEGGGHNLHSWIPFSLWRSNPEYWAMIDGERQHPNGYRNQICLSNLNGRKIFVESILQRIESTPQMKAADCFNIKIEDNWGSCECEECLRPIRLPDGTLLKSDDIAFRSTQFFMFLNSVANAIHNQGYPKMMIGTYVYFFTVPVPKVPTTDKLRPYFADYVRKDYKQPIFAPINDIWWRTLNEWTAVSENVVVREYTGLFVSFRALAEVAAYDIRAELAVGVREFTSESLPLQASSSAPNFFGASQLDVAFIEYWIITRLYWEPEANVEQLRKYAIRRSFREAAPAMERFYGTLRQLYFKEQRATDFEENEETLRLAYLKGEEGNLRICLDEALAEVRHPLSKVLVQQVKNFFEAQMTLTKSDLTK